jgi:hypothetical protein
MWAAAMPDEEMEMAIVRRIGMPENDSETRAIRRLAKGLPDNYVVFQNFELTTGRGLP